MNKIVMMLGLVLAALQVNAEGVDTKQIYFGGGLGLNDANFGDSAIGFQVFAGLPIPIKNDNMDLLVEVGYMDTGNFERSLPFTSNATAKAKANGLWGTAVASIPMKDKVDVLARVGLDIGDDDGVMIGAGVGFEMSSSMDLRVEYVMRDTIDSFQVNLVIR
ncbi:MAG: outer membrane beta-barrel protein [Gammaproteobacteria bacterium]|nr:outer membrane beta-barrel protein [Gammaproteobacteria bacterium]